MKERLINIIKLLISILSFFMIGNIISSFISFDESNVLISVIYQLVVSIIIFIILFILYYRNIKKDYKLFNKNKKDNILMIIKLFIIFIIIKYIVSFITALLMLILELDMKSITSVNQEMIENYVKKAPILMVITTSFLAPLYEEILFRLGFKKVLGNNILFVIISGTIFGLLHVFPLEKGISLTLGIVQSISYVVMGIFLAYIYKKTDNIFISIGVHFLNNFISVLTMINMF